MLEPHKPVEGSINKDEQEIVQKQKHEYKHLGTYLRTRGLKLWTYNAKSGKIKEVHITKGDTITIIPRDGKLVAVDLEMEKATVDSRNEYFEALNYPNALKRVRKLKSGKIKELCNLKEPGSIDIII